jgi:MFS family permease
MKPVLLIGLVVFIVGSFGFLPVYVHGLGYSATRSGAVVSIATAAYLLIQPVAGALADRYAMRTTVLLGLLVAALSIMAITFASEWILIVMVIAAGMRIGTVWTNSDALVSATASPSQPGASIGAAQSLKEFGDMVGPLLVGALTQLFGVRIGFVTCGAVAVMLLSCSVGLRCSALVKSGDCRKAIAPPVRTARSSFFIKGDGQKNRRLLAFSCRFLNGLTEKRAACAQ